MWLMWAKFFPGEFLTYLAWCSEGYYTWCQLQIGEECVQKEGGGVLLPEAVWAGDFTQKQIQSCTQTSWRVSCTLLVETLRIPLNKKRLVSSAKPGPPSNQKSVSSAQLTSACTKIGKIARLQCEEVSVSWAVRTTAGLSWTHQLWTMTTESYINVYESLGNIAGQTQLPHTD